MKIKRLGRISGIIGMTICLVLMCAVCVMAYDTPDFDVEITINKDYTFDYTENITVDFSYPQHGIYRNIPIDSHYKIKNIEVGGRYEYKVSTEDGNKIIRIGSEDIEIKGKHTYPISYTLQGLKNYKLGNDYIYIDVLPTGWRSDIDHAKVVIHYPDDMKWESIEYYSGGYGADEDQYGKWAVDESAHTITYEAYDLPYGCGATLTMTLPEGYWQGAASNNWIKRLAMGFIGAVLAAIAALRFTVGRDKRAVSPVEFYPPEGLTPVDVGYIVDGVVDRNDITSLFFYLAHKGYISIEEFKKDKFKFHRLAVPTGEKESVKRFYKGIFGSHAFDDIATTDEKYNSSTSGSIGGRMATAYSNIPDLIDSEFSGEHELFTRHSKIAETICKVLIFAVPAISVLLIAFYQNGFAGDEWGWLILAAIMGAAVLFPIDRICKAYYYRTSRKPAGTALKLLLWIVVYIVVANVTIGMTANYDIGFGDRNMAVVMFLFMLVAPIVMLGMRTRGDWANEIYGRVMGFKSFINTAELPKLNELVEQDPSYFYNILPYAYVFGLTKKWAKKFENIAMPEPDWYSPFDMGTGYRFDAFYMDTVVHSVSDTISSQVAKSLDTGSSVGGILSGGGSDFSGGGFSGGGFGGGGGGSW